MSVLNDNVKQSLQFLYTGYYFNVKYLKHDKLTIRQKSGFHCICLVCFSSGIFRIFQIISTIDSVIRLKNDLRCKGFSNLYDRQTFYSVIMIS